MVHVIESKKSIDEIAGALPGVIAKHKFGLIGFHDLKQKMNDKGVAFDRECRVFDVCNPNKAKAVLDRDMRVSTVLPCRISAYQDGAGTKLAMVAPTTLLGLFGVPELQTEAEEVEATLLAIMREAA